MAKKIIVLERTDNNRFSVAFWLVTPVARQAFYANPNAASAFKNATPQELSDIVTGVVVEHVGDFAYPVGTSLAAVQVFLIAEYNNRQAALNARNPWDRYGTFWDGTGWTGGGVA